ncbi:regulatory protein RecX [Nocardioides sp. SYSU D00065]|uniref:regulatory protein RecX n=1 Tax=Nocardioides sp. SYSU D00065 TaxID=2817378 RepID=UPI001B337589|nr:regulatory protein RecX [Nocardioides sp. SYSU D00065]
MTSESRPAPDWVGDVSLGVQAWVGQSPPAPAADPAADPAPVRGRDGSRRRGRGRGRTRTPAERAEAKAAAAAAAAAAVEADPEGVGRTILLDSLTGQARTRKELADKLAKRDVPQDVATELLDRFTEVGLIDDAAYAQQWVESRHRSRGLAPRALAQELRRKGVDDEATAAALEQIDDADERVAARALVDKKLRSMSGLDRQVATRRLAGLLARKGYSAGLAFSVVREALGDAEDAEGDDLDGHDVLDTVDD